MTLESLEAKLYQIQSCEKTTCYSLKVNVDHEWTTYPPLVDFGWHFTNYPPTFSRQHSYWMPPKGPQRLISHDNQTVTTLQASDAYKTNKIDLKTNKDVNPDYSKACKSVVNEAGTRSPPPEWLPMTDSRPGGLLKHLVMCNQKERTHSDWWRWT